MARVRLEDHKMSMYMSLLWFGNRTVCIAIISEAANVCHVYKIEFYLRLFGTNHLHHLAVVFTRWYKPKRLTERKI